MSELEFLLKLRDGLQMAVDGITEYLGVMAPDKQTVKEPLVASSEKIKDVKSLFPDPLAALLTFEEKEDYVMVKPRRYLGSVNFAKIGTIVREAGGEYISDGKQSHFRVKIKTSSS